MREIRIALIDDNREFIQDFGQTLAQGFEAAGLQCDIQIYHDAFSFECAAAKDDKEEHGIGNQNVKLAAKKYGAIILYKKRKCSALH